jgi:hypothetical protein
MEGLSLFPHVANFLWQFEESVELVSAQVYAVADFAPE